jgi:hypothetical protein
MMVEITFLTRPSRPITTVPGSAPPSPNRSMWSVVPPSQIGKLIFVCFTNCTTCNLHPQCAELVLNGGEIRHLFSAGNTVSGPEVQDHYATLESSHTLFDAREIFQR